MRMFRVSVEFEDGWWMIYIPEIDGITQARTVGEIEEMAESYIVVDQGLGRDQFEIDLSDWTHPQ